LLNYIQHSLVRRLFALGLLSVTVTQMWISHFVLFLCLDSCTSADKNEGTRGKSSQFENSKTAEYTSYVSVIDKIPPAAPATA
jgi:hypothetical protein